MCYTAAFSSSQSASALQLISSKSLAFCDSAGDSTVDSLGRRVCYCGVDMMRDSGGVCRACPAGQSRGVGGAKSLVEECSCPTCPGASAGRRQLQAAAAPKTSLTLAQLKASCGAVCTAAASAVESELAVSTMVPQFEEDGEWQQLNLTWKGKASDSVLDDPDNTVRLSLYQLTGATAQNVSALWWSATDVDYYTQYYSVPASARTISIPYDWQAEFDAMQPPVNVDGYCADSSIVALELVNATGAVISTVYSQPFFICYGYGLNEGYVGLYSARTQWAFARLASVLTRYLLHPLLVPP
jgi:hypothetical protein